MTNQFLEEAKRELINGHSKKRHPFRYFVLATNENNKPRQRTVVLRKTFSDLSLIFIPIAEHKKIEDLQNNPDFSALFYNPKKLLQLRIEGRAELITDTDQIATYWHTIQESSKKDYTTCVAPGTPIKNPDAVDYELKENYFCVVRLVPNTIEYLQLKRPNHLRIMFTKSNAEWSGEFLVP